MNSGIRNSISSVVRRSAMNGANMTEPRKMYNLVSYTDQVAEVDMTDPGKTLAQDSSICQGHHYKRYQSPIPVFTR
jgi:hypothetical protein